MLDSVPTKRIIFIILVIVSTLLIVFLYLLPFIINYKDKRDLNKKVYKIIYGIAMDRDFYLINNFPLIYENTLIANIDHILFSNKYIYVINDKTYTGIIDGNKDDNILLNYSYKGKKTEINNPIILNDIRCNKFSSIKNISRDFIINIVVINNLVEIGDSRRFNSKSSFLCKRKDLKKTIYEIEKRSVNEFDPNVLDREVKEIAKDIYSRN